MWNQIKQWAKDFWVKSWTRLWGSLKLLAGSLFAVGMYLGNIVNDPSVRSAIAALDAPVWIGLGVAVLGAVTLLSMSHPDA